MNKTERKLTALSYVPPNKIAQHNMPRHIEIVPQLSMAHYDDEDDYVYHITTKPNAEKILQVGFRINQPPLMTNYKGYSKGKVFFTERPGVNFWLEKVEAHALDNFDDPPPVMLLRVPKILIHSRLHPDNVGTHDARVKSYYITTPFK
jgi:hypothetical protein